MIEPTGQLDEGETPGDLNRKRPVGSSAVSKVPVGVLSPAVGEIVCRDSTPVEATNAQGLELQATRHKGRNGEVLTWTSPKPACFIPSPTKGIVVERDPTS